MFELDYRLESDCVLVGSLSLCQVMLMKDANYPWLILVPRRENVSEIYQLDGYDQEQLIWESALVSERMMKSFRGDKMNIAALGNVVAQLHIHHVVRTESDPAWPEPIWGTVPAKAYLVSELETRVELIQEALRTSAFIPAA